MAIRAEDYKHSYLLGRLETEKELIPDESLLSLETESLEARAQTVRRQRMEARKQILKLKETVEEELYESGSGPSTLRRCSH